jgi:hypothetical protein
VSGHSATGAAVVVVEVEVVAAEEGWWVVDPQAASRAELTAKTLAIATVLFHRHPSVDRKTS